MFETLLRMSGTVFKNDICEKIVLHQPCEAGENNNTGIEELFCYNSSS